ncbi:zinc finger domain-containing protein [Halomonas sp.]|uniref:zinc finger domain-containing protein n=1 Tax=Halomonas sp. TaxID=1486246 RepID=UPI003A10226B
MARARCYTIVPPFVCISGVGCPRCGGSINREVVSGRGSYFCDSHQERSLAS